jgi:hypothetical protein
MGNLFNFVSKVGIWEKHKVLFWMSETGCWIRCVFSRKVEE